MKIIAELHAHSGDYCWHAKDNIDIQVQRAKEMGFKYYASTNHAPILDYGTPTVFYTDNLNRKYDGIKFLAGMEADIRDLYGGFDMSQVDLLELDFVIASIHSLPLGLPDYTNAYVKAAENPAVDCLGHIARDPDFPCDIETVLKAVKANGKLVEFNDASISDANRRRVKECGAVMDMCAKLGVDSIVTTDAHSLDRLGNNAVTLKLLEDKNFPEELIVNASEERMEAFLTRRKEEKKKALDALFTV